MIGQTHASPCRATAMPLTNEVEEAAITLPPWLVASPSRITFFMCHHSSWRFLVTILAASIGPLPSATR